MKKGSNLRAKKIERIVGVVAALDDAHSDSRIWNKTKKNSDSRISKKILTPESYFTPES
jgi:hypothetical protein